MLTGRIPIFVDQYGKALGCQLEHPALLQGFEEPRNFTIATIDSVASSMGQHSERVARDVRGVQGYGAAWP